MGITEWKEINGQLVREFSFINQTKAAEFALRVAKISDEVNHHADILLHSWNKLNVSICTHDEGNTISDQDHKWVELIDTLT